MRTIVLCLAWQLTATCAFAQSQLMIGNPTDRPYDLYFKPESANRFQSPPLKIEANELVALNIAAPGKYKTVLRSWTSPRRYVDSTIGWVDFHRAYQDAPAGEFHLEPFVRPETRTRTYTVIKYVYESRERRDGSTYSVRVAVPEEKTESYTVYVRGVRATFWISQGESVDGQEYISLEP